MKKVVVTGASGFIGRQILPLLKGTSLEVHAVTSKMPPEELKAFATWHTVNLLDAQRVSAFCKNVQADRLMHLAWYDGVHDRKRSLENMAWVEASLHLIRNFVESGGERIVYAGSCAEYDWNYGYCQEESTPTTPHTFYGQCKNSLHNILEKYCQQKGVSYACGRIFFVYGPHEFEDRLVAYIVNALLRNQRANLTHGNQLRDYLHVADVADALMKLLESKMTGPVNIASGRPVTLRTIANMIGKKLNKSELLSYSSREGKVDNHPVVLANTARLRDDLKWTPAYDLEEGITSTIDWWRNKQLSTANK